jgi:hypothetical protein
MFALVGDFVTTLRRAGGAAALAALFMRVWLPRAKRALPVGRRGRR